MSKRTNVVYIGKDILTLFLIAADPEFNLVAVNLNPGFLSHPGYAPGDLLFKLVYLLRAREAPLAIESAAALALRCTKRLSTSLYRSYADYLLLLSSRRIPLLDLDATEAAVKFLSERDVDLAVVNNWFMLDEAIISAPRRGVVNVHPARLPQYRGALPTVWALKNGDTSSAVSYIILDPGMDSGDLLAQHEFSIDPEDDSITIEHKVEGIVSATLVDDIKAYLSGALQTRPQGDENRSKTGKFYDYMRIDWSREAAKDIVNKINMYSYLWPPDNAYTSFRGRRVDICRARVTEEDVFGGVAREGEFRVVGRSLHVKAAGGVVLIDLPSGTTVRAGLRLLLAGRGRFGDDAA